MNEKTTIFWIFRPTQKIAPDGPKWCQEDFFLLIQTLPTFWAERILRIFIFFDFLDPKFPDFQVTDFQISRNLAWASLGLGLGRAWALGRVGPSAGPWPTLEILEFTNIEKNALIYRIWES